MRAIAAALALLTVWPSATAAPAQSNYPDKPIHILVGFLAGVAPDVTARLMGDRWNQTWAKGVVVENVLGAGGNIAVDRVAKSAPDGYTLAMGGNASLVINPNLMGKLSYDPAKDFAYITQVFIVPNLLVVRADSPAKSVKDLIALAKADPNYLIAGHAGVGTSQHLGGELFKAMAGVQMQQVAYRGTPGVLTDLLGGRLNVFFGNISNCLPLVREGKLRAFAVTSKKRSPQIPDLPTMEELGFPGFDATAWFGLIAPAGTPQPILDKLRDETTKFLTTPDIREKLESLGLQLVGNSPSEFEALIKTETVAWGKVIKDAGIKAQ